VSLDLTILILRQKYCNEGEVSLNFMALDDGSVGVVFQYINDKKYYALEFNSKYVRLKKIYDDAETVLAYKQVLGYVVN